MSLRLRVSGAPVTILMYHSIRTDPDDPHRLAVSPERFVDQLAVLARRVDVIRLQDLRHRVRRRSVVITFDDGYADNLHAAMPALESAGFPATVFVTTGTLGRDMWWDRLAALMAGQTADEADFTVAAGSSEVRVRYAGPDRWKQALWAVHAQLKPLDPEEIDSVLEELTRMLPADSPSEAPRMLTEDELEKLAQHDLLTIGAHTVGHEQLARRPLDVQMASIDESVRTLERLTGQVVDTFAYPFGGAEDFDDASVAACTESGIELACTTVNGRVGKAFHPHWLPRRMVFDWTAAEFEHALDEWRV